MSVNFDAVNSHVLALYDGMQVAPNHCGYERHVMVTSVEGDGWGLEKTVVGGQPVFPETIASGQWLLKQDGKTTGVCTPFGSLSIDKKINVGGDTIQASAFLISSNTDITFQDAPLGVSVRIRQESGISPTLDTAQARRGLNPHRHLAL